MKAKRLQDALKQWEKEEYRVACLSLGVDGTVTRTEFDVPITIEAWTST